MEIKPRDIVKCNEGKNNKIAFVFSCPGQEELNSEKLVFGQTGRNLESLLEELKRRDFIKEDFKDRYDFTITNSYNKVHYKGYLDKNDKRTEPLLSEVRTSENIERLTTELKEAEIIICFGKRPKIALEICKNNLKARVLYSRHLGLQSLNQINEDINGNKLTKGKEGNTDKRIQVVAQELIDQYNQSK
jgi:uracil-DNA glycosylase